MLRDYGVQGWFWWTAIAACGFSFVLGLDSATASERAPHSRTHGAAPSAVVSVASARSLAAPFVRTSRGASAAMVRTPTTVRSKEQPAPSEPTARGLRRLGASEVSAEMLVIARRIIREHHQARPGTEVSFESGGQNYVARIERHYHPEGGPVKPWGYHPGVSLLKAR